MALSRLGDYIELVNEKNSNEIYDVSSLRGISINKIFIKTKANTDNLNLRNYKIVKNKWFAYCTVTSRNGNKISIAYNDGDDIIVSSINPVFKVKDENKLLPRYLMMFFNRSEFDRYARFNSWGSARETFSWEDFCDIQIEIPSIDVQREYVELFEGMLINLNSCEKELNILQTCCDVYIEKLFKNSKKDFLFKYLTRRMEKNSNFEVKKLLGVGKEGFITPKQNKDETNGHICYLIKEGDFVYAPPQVHQGSIDLYKEKETAKCSDAYVVFYINKNDLLKDDYLLAVLKTPFFKKYAFYYRDGVREQLDFEQFCNFKVPVPSIDIQESIIDLFNQYNNKIKFIKEIKMIISNLCSILISGSLKNGK